MKGAGAAEWRTGLGARLLLAYGLGGPSHKGKWWTVQTLVRVLKLQPEPGIQKRGELLWHLDPSDFPQQDLFWYGEKDRWELLHIRRLLPRDPVFFDVGANFGYYAITLAKRCKAVYAFEPNPPTYALLAENAALNHLTNIHHFQIALGSRNGEVAMQQRPGNSGGQYIASGEGIPMVTLDFFCRSHGIEQIDFVKVDIEGYEEHFLLGAQEVLKKLRPMFQMEFSPAWLRRAGSSLASVVRLLHESGYQIFQPRRAELVPVQLPRGSDEINAFCIPAEKADFLN